MTLCGRRTRHSRRQVPSAHKKHCAGDAVAIIQRPNKDMDLDSITKPRFKPVSTRQPREIDVGRLGMWSRCPDRHMQNSKRHCDPLHPTYCIHEHELKPVAPRKVKNSMFGCYELALEQYGTP